MEYGLTKTAAALLGFSSVWNEWNGVFLPLHVHNEGMIGLDNLEDKEPSQLVMQGDGLFNQIGLIFLAAPTPSQTKNFTGTGHMYKYDSIQDFFRDFDEFDEDTTSEDINPCFNAEELADFLSENDLPCEVKIVTKGDDSEILIQPWSYCGIW
jgi:hypothetical protein